MTINKLIFIHTYPRFLFWQISSIIYMFHNNAASILKVLKFLAHFMMTSSNGNIFRVTRPLWGEFVGEFPSQRPVTRSFDVLFDLRKRLSKQSWRWWFERPSCPLWRHCNVLRSSHTEIHANIIVIVTREPLTPTNFGVDAIHVFHGHAGKPNSPFSEKIHPFSAQTARSWQKNTRSR